MDAVTEGGSGRHTLDPIMHPKEEPTAKAAGPQGLEGGPAAHKPSPETQVSTAAGHIWDSVRDAIWGEGEVGSPGLTRGLDGERTRCGPCPTERRGGRGGGGAGAGAPGPLIHTDGGEAPRACLFLTFTGLQRYPPHRGVCLTPDVFPRKDIILVVS